MLQWFGYDKHDIRRDPEMGDTVAPPVKDRMVASSNKPAAKPVKDSYYSDDNIKQDLARSRRRKEQSYKEMDKYLEPVAGYASSPSLKTAYDYSLGPWISMAKEERNYLKRKEMNNKKISNGNGASKLKPVRQKRQRRKAGKRKAKRNNNVAPALSAMPIQKAEASIESQIVPAAFGSTFRQKYGGMTSNRIIKCEYITDLRPTTANFQVLIFPINPGQPTLFPWLSTIADSWEYYMINRFRIIYKPNAASTAVGTVAIAVDYDNYDSTPLSKQQLAEFKPYVSGVPWSSSIIYDMPNTLAKLHNNGKLLVRSGYFSGDKNLNDVGLLYVATQDVTPGYLGELYVDYDITLINQQTNNVPVSGGLNATVAALVPFNSGRVLQTGSSPAFDYSPSAPTTSIVIYRAGQYLVNWSISGATTLTGMSIAVTGTSATINIQNTFLVNAAGDTGRVSYEVNCPVLDQTAPPTLVFTLVGSSGVGSSVVRISQWNNAIV